MNQQKESTPLIELNEVSIGHASAGLET